MFLIIVLSLLAFINVAVSFLAIVSGNGGEEASILAFRGLVFLALSVTLWNQKKIMNKMGIDDD